LLEQSLDVEGGVAPLRVIASLGELLEGIRVVVWVVRRVELGVVEGVGLGIADGVELGIVDGIGGGLGSRVCMGAPALLSGRPRGPKKVV
jgi:hypothetical protein